MPTGGSVENVEPVAEVEAGAEKELTKEEMGAALEAGSMEFYQIVRLPDGQTGIETTNGIGSLEGNKGNEGAYCENNGVLAYVDQKGNCRIMASSDKAKQFLDDLGYVSKNMWVPMSNGETIVNNAANNETTQPLTYLQDRWEATLSKKIE